MFYEKLQYYCKKRGVVLTNLIKELGLSTGNLSKWKSGGRPRAATGKKIADYLEVSLDDLFSDAPPEKALNHPALEMNDIQYALYHETADVSEDTLSRILEFARFAKAEEEKRKHGGT